MKYIPCKNHIMFCDYVEQEEGMPTGASLGSSTAMIKILLLIPHILPVVWHNMTCPENHHWHAKSEENYQKYDRHAKEWYKSVYHITKQSIQQIQQTQLTETLLLR